MGQSDDRDMVFIDQIMPQIKSCIFKYGKYINGYDREDLVNEGIAAGLSALREWRCTGKSKKTDVVNWAKLAILNTFKNLCKVSPCTMVNLGDIEEETLFKSVDAFMQEMIFGEKCDEFAVEYPEAKDLAAQDSDASGDAAHGEIEKIIAMLPNHQDFLNVHCRLGVSLSSTSKVMGKKIQRISQIKSKVLEDTAHLRKRNG